MSSLSTLLVLLGPVLLWAGPGSGLVLPESSGLRRLLEAQRNASSRGRRAVGWAERHEILQLHNKLRGGVYPTAANMESMVWDDELERSASHWAHECQWDHGPQTLLMSIGQNLAVHWGRHRSAAYHVQAWYDEVKDYTYPYPQECNPWCPDRCSGPMCTHYTQLVWATTTRVGCAVHTCPRMSVWGEVWENSVYLVCNYSPKGNWIGEAPYQHGRPCSQCPPSYGGGCKNNLCHLDTQPRPESEDMNEVEKSQRPSLPRPTSRPPAPKPKPSAPRRPSARPAGPRGSTHLAQSVKCETRLRDKCRGATCNRYKCPANCLNKKGNVWGNLFYDVLSSICRAAIHYGAIDNKGGLVDVTRADKFPFFVKATRNRIESLSKQKPSNAFSLAKVEEMSVDCYTTVAEICPFKKASSSCPRVFCPTSCKGQPSYWAPVIGNTIYSDSSSICKAAIHAGVIPAEGGYVDVLPLVKRKNYVGVLKNGVQSESKSNTEGGSFRTFAVRE